MAEKKAVSNGVSGPVILKGEGFTSRPVPPSPYSSRPDTRPFCVHDLPIAGGKETTLATSTRHVVLHVFFIFACSFSVLLTASLDATAGSLD